MDAVEYSNYFEALATNHKQIGHVKGSHDAFIQVIQPRVNDPFSHNLWLVEFFRLLQSGIKFPCLVLENYVWDHSDNNADQFTKRCTGAFIVLAQAIKDNPTSIVQTCALTEQITDDLISHIKEDFHIKFRNHAFSLNDAAGENVGPVEDIYWGSRIDFAVTFSNKSNIKYNPAKWKTPLVGYL